MRRSIFYVFFMIVLSCFIFKRVFFPWQQRRYPAKNVDTYSPNHEDDSVRKATIVTAVDNGYYFGLKNLIGSLHFWEPDRDIVVYNLGLDKQYLDELSNMCGVTVHWPAGIPAYLPDHTHILKAYAWKPFAIKDAVDRYEKIFWMDGGSDVRAPLGKLDSDLEQDGCFYVQDGGVMVTELSHPGIYQFMNLSMSDFNNKNVFYGTYQGYIKGRPAYYRILKPLLHCAEDSNCISPPGSSLANHRFDQTALSLCIHLSGIEIHTLHHDFESWQRHSFEISPTKPSSRLVYTARAHSYDYLQYINTKNKYLECERS